MKKYTVISVNVETGFIYSDHVEADEPLNAFAKVLPKRTCEVSFVVAIEGHLKEGSGLTFPGDCTVFTETVAEQTDVFGTP